MKRITTARAHLEPGIVIRRSDRPCVCAATAEDVFRSRGSVNSLSCCHLCADQKPRPLVFSDGKLGGLEERICKNAPWQLVRGPCGHERARRVIYFDGVP